MSATIARLIGGAGTGKTTWLMDTMEKVLDAGVRDPFKIGFVSFTRAAREEASTRAAAKFGVDATDLTREGNFRTLHSVCYKAMGVSGDTMITSNRASGKWLTEWLDEELQPVDDQGADCNLAEVAFAHESPTGRVLAMWGAARNRLVSFETVWLEARRCDDRCPSLGFCRDIVDRYERGKRLDSKLDFVDLLGRFVGLKFDFEGASESISGPQGDVPGVPVWFFDEQQDASPLLDRVCHRLINTPIVKWVYVVGDPFQSIYRWAGAEASLFRAWPAAQEKIMPKSYRCPAAVLRIGERMLSRCSDYFDRQIAPADHEGSVRTEWGLGFVESLKPTESTLVLARTNMLAARLAAKLDAAGIPWAPTRGRGGWLAPVRNLGIGGLYNLEHGAPISGHEWVQILKLIPSKLDGEELLLRGTKSRFEAANGEADRYEWVLPHELDKLGATPKLCALVESGQWKTLVKDAPKVTAAIDRYGNEVITEPKIKVGTIHSVKGQEADKVVLLTTTSGPVARSAETREGHDEEQRVGYVAATRARRELVCLRERSAMHWMEVA